MVRDGAREQRHDTPREAEGTQQRALRVALLALAIASSGSEGISWARLEAMPPVRVLYSDDPKARYAALRRDLEVLTHKPLRAQHQGDTAAESETAPVLYDTALDRYRLRTPVKRLLLAAEAVEALCVLARAVHGGAALPGGRDLFERLAEALGGEERQQLETALHSEKLPRETGITLEFGLRESMGGLELVMSQLWRAWHGRQTVQFSYRADGRITKHFHDEVLEIWLGDHAYASVWCEEANHAIELRLDRIVPETLKQTPRTAQGRRHRGIPIRYRLDAKVARGEVTRRLEEQTVEWEDDGSAIVSGRARSLFWARQMLLHYGGHARALEPPTLVAALRHESERMRQTYADDEDAGATAGGNQGTTTRSSGRGD